MKGVCSIHTLSPFFTAYTFFIKNFPRKQGFFTAALSLNKYFSIYIYMYTGNLAKKEITLNNAHKDTSNQILVPAGAFGY